MQAHLSKPVPLADLDKILKKWTTPAYQLPAPAAAGASEPLKISPALRDRFEMRKRRPSSAPTRSSTSVPSLREVEELCGLFHKLAGSPGLFGEASPGEYAASFEEQLPIRAVEVRASKAAGAVAQMRSH